MYLTDESRSSHPLLFLLFVGVGLLVAIVVAIRNPKEGFWATFVKAALASFGVYVLSAALSTAAFFFGLIALGAIAGLVDILTPSSDLFDSVMGCVGWFGIWGVTFFIIICQLAVVVGYVWKKSPQRISKIKDDLPR
jgi:hypothetical protein